MINRIKALYDDGSGFSIRAIVKETNLSWNTVRKYLRLDEVAISQQLNDPSRSKQLDQHLTYIKHLLETFPGLTATKILRKLQIKFPELYFSYRTVRRYVSTVRKQVCVKQVRYYEPVLDMVPSGRGRTAGSDDCWH